MKKYLKVLIIVFVFLIISSFALYLFTHLNKTKSMPTASKGVLDLAQWNFAQDGPIQLNGEWEFYWNQLLTPRNFAKGSAKKPVLTGYIKVPAPWARTVNGRKIPRQGCATYRIILKNAQVPGLFAIEKFNIQLASKVFINGQPLLQDGMPALTLSKSISGNIPQIASIQLDKGQTEIIIQVANYDYVDGGIVTPIRFGLQKDIVQEHDQRVVFEVTTITMLLAIGLIYLILYLAAYMYRRKEPVLLTFAINCILFAIANSLLSERPILYVLPFIPFNVTLKALDFVIFAVLISDAVFLNQMGETILSSRFKNIVVGLFGIYLLMIVALPVNTYMSFLFIFILITLTFIFGVLINNIVLFLQSKHQDLGSAGHAILVFAWFCLAVYTVNLVLYSIGLATNLLFGQISIVFYTISLVLLLSLRFSHAYRTIEEMSQKLIEADKLKDEFLVTTAHELRTPLHAIQNMIQATLDEVAASLDHKQQDNLNLVVRIIQRLTGLINDILDFSKIKRQEIQFNWTPVNVAMVVDTAFDVFRYIRPGKNVQLLKSIPDYPPAVLADENRLRQVMYNLIGNSIKFTEQGCITVTAMFTEDVCFISVEDTGIGIPAPLHDEIFNAFAQGKTSISREYGGTGLGLSISRQLVELMGGRLYLEWSEPGKGTKFTFTLPVAPQPATKHEKIVSDTKSMGFELQVKERSIQSDAEFTILAVDDEPANLLVLLNTFAQDPYNVVTARSGEEALEILRSNRKVDLVLLDIMMPKMSGLEVCRRLRQKHTNFDLPILLLSALYAWEDVALGLETGANDYLTKPFDSRELRARVKTFLALKKSVNDALANEMSFLQAQIKPHFLFNTMSSIISLCYTDGRKAGELLTHLSSYLRKCFDFNNTRTYVSLASEFELTQSYLEIEKARFGDDVQVEYDVDQSLLNYQILPLTIQPLVENAVRHGILQREEGGTIKLTIRWSDGISISVEDNGVGMSNDFIRRFFDIGSLETHRPGGVGLANIHRRLLKFYGDGLSIESTKNVGTKVQFKIPLI